MQDIAAVLADEYPKGIDVVYEAVGGKLREVALQHPAPKGRLLGVGYMSNMPHALGYPQPGVARSDCGKGQAQLLGSMLFEYVCSSACTDAGCPPNNKQPRL